MSSHGDAWSRCVPWGIFRGCRQTCVVAVLLAVAGCGGGGASQAVPDIAVANVSVTSISGEVFSDENPQSGHVSFDIVGDWSLLKANGIFLQFEGHNTPFYFSSTLLDRQSKKAFVDISPQMSSLPLGLNQGTLKVRVCADDACREPLSGSPISVPYAVRVLQALSFDVPNPTDGITIEAPFGQVMEQLPITLKLPEGTTSVSVDPGQVVRRGQSVEARAQGPIVPEDLTSVDVRVELAPTAKVLLTGQLRSEGTYYTHVAVTANYTTPSGREGQVTKTLPVHYKVTASPLPYLLNRSSFSFEVSPEVFSTSNPLQVLGPSGGIDSYSIEYLPPDGSGNLDAGSQAWLEMHDEFVQQTPPWQLIQVVATRCNVYRGDSVECMAPGRYEAVVHIRVKQSDGSTLDVPVPVSLSVKP